MKRLRAFVGAGGLELTDWEFIPCHGCIACAQISCRYSKEVVTRYVCVFPGSYLLAGILMQCNHCSNP